MGDFFVLPLQHTALLIVYLNAVEYLTKAQRDNAANWLMNCGVAPLNTAHRGRMWGIVKGGLW